MAAQTAETAAETEGTAGAEGAQITPPPVDAEVVDLMDDGPIMWGLDQGDWLFIFVLGLFLVGLMQLLARVKGGED